MTMTPEERAIQLSTAFVARFVKEPPDIPGHRMVYCDIEPMEEDLIDLIAQAIRGAEDAALERAAVVVQTRISMPAASFKCAGETLRDQNGDEYFLGARTVNELIERKASNIRALKHNKD